MRAQGTLRASDVPSAGSVYRALAIEYSRGCSEARNVPEVPQCRCLKDLLSGSEFHVTTGSENRAPLRLLRKVYRAAWHAISATYYCKRRMPVRVHCQCQWQTPGDSAVYPASAVAA
jgi:hypothetical protein